jgi:uncharacterized RDD family membrane protein YckC
MQMHGRTKAGWWARVAATLIDTVVAAVVGLAAMYTAVLLVYVGGGTMPQAETWGMVAFASVYLNYAPLLMQRGGRRNGQTLGKQALGIRVIRADGGTITWGRALARELVGKGALGLIPLYSLFDALWPLSDARAQALHDKLAATLAVRAAGARAPRAPGWAPPAPPAPSAGWPPAPNSVPPPGWQ